MDKTYFAWLIGWLGGMLVGSSKEIGYKILWAIIALLAYALLLFI